MAALAAALIQRLQHGVARRGLQARGLGALMHASPRIQRIGAQVVAPAGQHPAPLRRPARVMAWRR